MSNTKILNIIKTKNTQKELKIASQNWGFFFDFLNRYSIIRQSVVLFFCKLTLIMMPRFSISVRHFVTIEGMADRLFSTCSWKSTPNVVFRRLFCLCNIRLNIAFHIPNLYCFIRITVKRTHP